MKLWKQFLDEIDTKAIELELQDRCHDSLLVRKVVGSIITLVDVDASRRANETIASPLANIDESRGQNKALRRIEGMLTSILEKATS